MKKGNDRGQITSKNIFFQLFLNRKRERESLVLKNSIKERILSNIKVKSSC